MRRASIGAVGRASIALTLALLAACAGSSAKDSADHPAGLATAAEPAALRPGEEPLEGCTLKRVVDGDTLEFSCDEGRGKVLARLVGYDTPEISEPGCEIEKLLGYEAALRLGDWLLAAKNVTAEPTGRDRYGRVLMRLALDGENVAERMVAAGLAVPYGGGRRIDWCKRLAERSGGAGMRDVKRQRKARR